MSAMPVILFLDHLPNIRKNQTQYGHGHEILAVCPDVHFNTIDLVPRGYGERHVFIRPGSYFVPFPTPTIAQGCGITNRPVGTGVITPPTGCWHRPGDLIR